MKGPCSTPGCASYAINPHLHGRDPGVDLDLCDACYWRKRALDWKKWPEERPSDGKSGIYLCRNDNDQRWWKKFWRGFYSLGQWDAGDDLTHWAEIPLPKEGA